MSNGCSADINVKGFCLRAVGHWPDGVRKVHHRHTIPANSSKTIINSGVYASPHVGDGTVTCSGSFSHGNATYLWSASK